MRLLFNLWRITALMTILGSITLSINNTYLMIRDIHIFGYVFSAGIFLVLLALNLGLILCYVELLKLGDKRT